MVISRSTNIIIAEARTGGTLSHITVDPGARRQSLRPRNALYCPRVPLGDEKPVQTQVSVSMKIQGLGLAYSIPQQRNSSRTSFVHDKYCQHKTSERRGTRRGGFAHHRDLAARVQSSLNFTCDAVGVLVDWDMRRSLGRRGQPLDFRSFSTPTTTVDALLATTSTSTTSTILCTDEDTLSVELITRLIMAGAAGLPLALNSQLALNASTRAIGDKNRVDVFRNYGCLSVAVSLSETPALLIPTRLVTGGLR